MIILNKYRAELDLKKFQEELTKIKNLREPG
jgi:hypothetical protein